MEPSPFLEDIKSFFAEVRRTGGQLGLEPEFSALESFLTIAGRPHLERLRENLDRFFFGRGISVLERLRDKATQMQRTEVGEALGQFEATINSLFQGQFISEDKAPPGFLPQSQMLRDMLQKVNENRADDVIALIEKNIQDLDGHFFMILSEAMRNATERQLAPTHEILLMIGRLVAEARVKHKLPCSFAAIWSV